MVEGKPAVWLQNVGFVQAKRMRDFKVGDKIAYNNGYYGVIVEKNKVSPKFYEIKTRERDGKIYTSRVKADTFKPFFE